MPPMRSQGRCQLAGVDALAAHRQHSLEHRAMLPATIVSVSAVPTRPSSMRKLFLTTPEKSPFGAGAPIEKRPTSAPRGHVAEHRRERRAAGRELPAAGRHRHMRQARLAAAVEAGRQAAQHAAGAAPRPAASRSRRPRSRPRPARRSGCAGEQRAGDALADALARTARCRRSARSSPSWPSSQPQQVAHCIAASAPRRRRSAPPAARCRSAARLRAAWLRCRNAACAGARQGRASGRRRQLNELALRAVARAAEGHQRRTSRCGWRARCRRW